MAITKRVFVFGNPYLEEDSFALQVGRHLKKIKVVPCENPDFLLDLPEEHITILDVVQNIKKPILIKDLTQLQSRTMVSLHDFDLGFFLLLIKKLGIPKKIKIIGVPQQGDAQKIASQVKPWI